MLAVVGKCARDGSWGMVCVGRMGLGGWGVCAFVRVVRWDCVAGLLGDCGVGDCGVAVLVLPCLERLLLAGGGRGLPL